MNIIALIGYNNYERMMRMQRVLNFDTLEYESLCSFKELPEHIKEQLRQNTQDLIRDTDSFTEYCNEVLSEAFGKYHDLKVAYSLSYCQGDGLVIYGKLDLGCIVDAIQEDNNYWRIEYFEKQPTLTQLEWAIVQQTRNEVGGRIDFNHNGRYCNWGNMSCEYDSDYMYDAEHYAIDIIKGVYYRYKQSPMVSALEAKLNLDEDEAEQVCADYVSDILGRFAQLVIDAMQDMAGSLEQQGYNYFYNITDEEVEEHYSWNSNAMNIVFDEEGNWFEKRVCSYRTSRDDISRAGKTILTLKLA